MKKFFYYLIFVWLMIPAVVVFGLALLTFFDPRADLPYEVYPYIHIFVMLLIFFFLSVFYMLSDYNNSKIKSLLFVFISSILFILYLALFNFQWPDITSILGFSSFYMSPSVLFLIIGLRFIKDSYLEEK